MRLIQLTVNGQPRQAPARMTVSQLLAELKLAPRGIAVEVNQQVVPRGKHAEHELADGDRLEIVSLVGGG